MLEEENKLAIALPGEWALRKVLGPALDEFGEDLKKLYAIGRDKILSVAYRRVRNPEDGKKANLRVLRDVLWSGAFTEDEVCAEYFGGVLAASRSEDGKDDNAVHFVDVIKSLSAKQLHLHYVIYRTLNALLIAAAEPVNAGLDTEIERCQVWFAANELAALGLRVDMDLNILHRQGLVRMYKIDGFRAKGQILPYVSVNPTTFGVVLYAAAQNRLLEWRSFDRIDFGDSGAIRTPALHSSTLEGLVSQSGLVEDDTPHG